MSLNALLFWCGLFGCFPVFLRAEVERQHRILSDQHSVLSIEFESAEGLRTNDRVLVRGAPVGTVTSSPKLQNAGQGVVVEVTLTRLPSEHTSLLNRNMTASIAQDGRDKKCVVLYFSNNDAPMFTRSEVVAGVDSYLELAAWRFLHQLPRGSERMDRAVGLLFEPDPAKTGIAVYRINLVGFFITLTAGVAMAIKGISKLLGSTNRRKPPSACFLFIWQLFMLFASLKAGFLLAVFVSEVLGMTLLPDLEPWVILPENLLKLIRWDFRFGIVALALIALRFNTSLLGLLVRRP